MQRLSGIFIDFYGTIAAGDRAAVEAVCQSIVDNHRLEVTARDLAVAWGRQFFELIDHCNGHDFRNLVECERQSLCELMQSYVKDFNPGPPIAAMQAYLQAPPLHDEVHEVLAALDLPVVVVSNVDREDLDCAIARHNLSFTATITSEDARSYKPHPGLFEYALSKTGWSPDRVLHVGDSLHSDVAGARNAGLTAVWIHRTDRISDIGRDSADFTFPNLRGLLEITTNQGPLNRVL